jgi:hypothetical protein
LCARERRQLKNLKAALFRKEFRAFLSVAKVIFTPARGGQIRAHMTRKYGVAGVAGTVKLNPAS